MVSGIVSASGKYMSETNIKFRDWNTVHPTTSRTLQKNGNLVSYTPTLLPGRFWLDGHAARQNGFGCWLTAGHHSAQLLTRVIDFSRFPARGRAFRWSDTEHGPGACF
jgi:hypothetical protein